MTNVMEKIKAVSCKIKAPYTLTMGDFRELCQNSPDSFVLISNAFNFGYLQGLKAAKAEAKRQKKLAQTTNLDKQQKKNNLL